MTQEQIQIIAIICGIIGQILVAASYIVSILLVEFIIKKTKP